MAALNISTILNSTSSTTTIPTTVGQLTQTPATPLGSTSSTPLGSTLSTPLGSTLSTPLAHNGTTTSYVFESDPSSQACIRSIDDDWLVFMFPVAVRYLNLA